MSESDYNVVFVSMEMMIPELSEPARGSDFRGGLGILAGDIMEGLAKQGIASIGIVPFFGFNWISHEKVNYSDTPAQFQFELKLEGIDKHLKVWKIHRGGTEVYGLEGPDTFNVLYTGDREQRFSQELAFGKAVPALLKKLGIKPSVVWAQESHTMLAIPYVQSEEMFRNAKYLYTTHTSVPEGLEKYDGGKFDELGIDAEKYRDVFVHDGALDLSYAAIRLADRVTAVSKEHGDIVRAMFPERTQKISGIMNGSSRSLWLSPHIKEIENLMDFHQLAASHQVDKHSLLDFARKRSKTHLDPKKPVISWVRRIASYKNQLPMLEPIIAAVCAERGMSVDTQYGKLDGLGMQIVCAGRAHETDTEAQEWVSAFTRWMSDPRLEGKFVFIEDYSLELLKIGARGCDIWLSCPKPKMEACGTSDQRAAINGNINVITNTGGAREYIKEFNEETGEGNGFLIESYEPKTVYDKLKRLSDYYYAWQKDYTQNTWVRLRQNAYESGKKLDISSMIEEYRPLFEELANSKKSG